MKSQDLIVSFIFISIFTGAVLKEPTVFLCTLGALGLFGFNLWLDRYKAEELHEINEKLKALEEKMSVHLAFGGKRG